MRHESGTIPATKMDATQPMRSPWCSCGWSSGPMSEKDARQAAYQHVASLHRPLT